MKEQRNTFGFPVIDKLEAAKKYAAAVRLRNTTPCACVTCKQIEMLPVVQKITNNWRNK